MKIGEIGIFCIGSIILSLSLICGVADAEGEGNENQPERNRREDHSEPSRQRTYPEN